MPKSEKLNQHLITTGYFLLPILFFVLSSIKPLAGVMYFAIAILSAALLRNRSLESVTEIRKELISQGYQTFSV